MICDRSICGNSFDVPEVMVTIADRNSGAAWGYYCSHSCAMVDSDTILSHLGDDKDIGSLEGITIDASNVNQATNVEVQPTIPVPTEQEVGTDETQEGGLSVAEADQAFEDLLQQEEAIETGWQVSHEETTTLAPTAEQAVMDHVVQNTPQNTNAVGVLRDKVVNLFCSNLGLLTEPEVNLGDEGVFINLRTAQADGGPHPDIFVQVVISPVDTVQILFGDGDVNNMQIDPEAVTFDEISGFLLQKVGEKMQQVSASATSTASPDEPF